MRSALVVMLALTACVAPAASPRAVSSSGSSTTPAFLSCRWPAGAEAAVSLTYDDAMPSQLKYAVPVLQQHGLRATFFLSGRDLSGFAPLARTGHELAAHTATHPCHADLARLTPAEMGLELDASIQAVHALGQLGKLTFAYPCGETRVAGGVSYVPEVRRRFRAARGVSPSVAVPAALDLANVPAFFPPSSSDGNDVIAFVEQARTSGAWAVIGVHGVSEAGEYLQLSQPAHDKVIAYLSERRESLWTAPFGSVADVVAKCQSAAGK